MLGPARSGVGCRVLVSHLGFCAYLLAQLLFSQELQGVWEGCHSSWEPLA